MIATVSDDDQLSAIGTGHRRVVNPQAGLRVLPVLQVRGNVDLLTLELHHWTDLRTKRQHQIAEAPAFVFFSTIVS